jgi:hypothetical protein
MNKIKIIRQGLVEIRNIITQGENLSEDQFMTLESLSYHDHYGIRRQASGLLIKISKKYRTQIYSGNSGPMALESN